ncbi:lactococcin 972 family bacteriocin [Curtobacterium sp. NPDC086286]|uniref:lactococcin 972 family bacteriocin n=1 Tax=Curtobacterium sp. NPDC086286 TaxID=3363964 RepID=UPI003818F2CE
MKKRTMQLSVAVVAAAIIPALTTAGVAHATVDRGTITSGSAAVDGTTKRAATEVVGGGFWSYGVDKTDVWSLYDHQKLVHSTAVKSSGKTTSSGRVAKGKVAYASRGKALFGNSSFWNIY